MNPRFVLGSFTALLLVGCPTPTDPAAKSRQKPEPEPIGTTDEPVTKPEPNPTLPAPVLPSLDDAPAVPEVKVLAVATECPPLAKLPEQAAASQLALVPTIELLRGLACNPASFGQSTAEILTTLAPAEGVKLEIGRRYATIEFAEPIAVADILAVAGISNAKLAFEQGFTSNWQVVDASGHPPIPWPPGELHLRVRGERNDDTADGTITEIGADAQVDAVTIVMPETAIEFSDDPFASAALVAALTALAEDPSKLDGGALPSLGDRYTNPAYSRGSGANMREGMSIRPNRTELIAGDLARALGLTAASQESIDITDTNPNRMASAGKTPFVWRGLELEIELSERPGKHFGLAGWVVTDVLVLPAEPAQ
jgi:hypothetical protein